MDLQNIENTLKKMGLVLEKIVQKIDELDKRVNNIEEKLGKNEKMFSSLDFKTTTQSHVQQNQQNSISKSLSNGFGSSFLGSMAGTMAGSELYNLLFNHSITPIELGESLGMDQNEIDEVLENNFDEINEKIDELDEKINELEKENIINNDYF